MRSEKYGDQTNPVVTMAPTVEYVMPIDNNGAGVTGSTGGFIAGMWPTPIFLALLSASVVEKGTSWYMGNTETAQATVNKRVKLLKDIEASILIALEKHHDA